MGLSIKEKKDTRQYIRSRSLHMLCPKCQRVYEFGMAISYHATEERIIYPAFRYFCPNCKLETYDADQLLIPALQKLNRAHFHTQYHCSVIHEEDDYTTPLESLTNTRLSEELFDKVKEYYDGEDWYIGPHIIISDADEIETRWLYEAVRNQVYNPEDEIIVDYKIRRDGDWKMRYNGRLPVVFEGDDFCVHTAIRNVECETLVKANKLLSDIIDQWLLLMEQHGVDNISLNDEAHWSNLNWTAHSVLEDTEGFYPGCSAESDE